MFIDKDELVVWMPTHKFTPVGSLRYRCKHLPQVSLTLSGREVGEKKKASILFSIEKKKKTMQQATFRFAKV